MAKGYSCVVDQEPALAQSGLFTVSAIRGERQRHGSLAASRDSEAQHTTNLQRHVDEFSRRSAILHAAFEGTAHPVFLSGQSSGPNRSGQEDGARGGRGTPGT